MISTARVDCVGSVGSNPGNASQILSLHGRCSSSQHIGNCFLTQISVFDLPCRRHIDLGRFSINRIVFRQFIFQFAVDTIAEQQAARNSRGKPLSCNCILPWDVVSTLASRKMGQSLFLG